MTAAPSERLREVARALREAATVATPGVWSYDPDGQWVYATQPATGYEDAVATLDQIGNRDGNGPWIALASPSLAEPLAAWLEAVASEADCGAAATSIAQALALTDALLANTGGDRG